MQAALCSLFVHLCAVVQNVSSSLAICILKIFNKLLGVQAFALVSVLPVSASELKPRKPVAVGEKDGLRGLSKRQG